MDNKYGEVHPCLAYAQERWTAIPWALYNNVNARNYCVLAQKPVITELQPWDRMGMDRFAGC
ncbi:MAG TPA: hypothetical protein VKZ98_02845 [Aquaticitalea sp.]|nr:hypothetical protein [Aquaticitalea sp.]